ncbi:MAG: hypothetical protein J6X86_03350 [Bacteroidales bacterium]|nr:hypothetical protein [Bacteroidales bacterium]
MASMINSPETVQRLRDNLLETVDGLKEQLSRTESAMETVAKDWKDPQFQKYNEEFTEDKEKIPPLCNDIEDFEKEVLYPLQKIMEEYLDL